MGQDPPALGGNPPGQNRPGRGSLAQTALVVAGPTCSGKSAFALAAAQRLGGTVINADSMQVYRELRILTARPTPEEEALVPHALYGVRPAAEPGSAAWWADAALKQMRAAWGAGRVPILCGGTGFYIQALRHSLLPVPDIPPEARAEARRMLAEEGAPVLHARLAEADPATAARLRPGDGQRIARAWEVWRGTGRPLSQWIADSAVGPPPCRFAAILLDPPRDELRQAIRARFDAMLRDGAIEEVRALLALDLGPALPAMRAHGVPEIARYLRDESTLEEAATRAVLATGQYTKRQATWFRHHDMAAPNQTHTIHARWTVGTQFSETMEAFLRIVAAQPT